MPTHSGDGRQRAATVKRSSAADTGGRPQSRGTTQDNQHFAIDLPWIVYAVEEYLDNLTSYMRQLDSEHYENVDPERLTEGLRRLSEVSDERWAQLIAREIDTAPRQPELISIYHDAPARRYMSYAQAILRVFADVLEQVREDGQQPDSGSLQHRLGYWRHELELPPRFTRIFGEQVLQIGRFKVFEELDTTTNGYTHGRIVQQRDDGVVETQRTGSLSEGCVCVTYSPMMESSIRDSSDDQAFGEVDIGLFIALQRARGGAICEPIRAWLAEKAGRAGRQRNGAPITRRRNARGVSRCLQGTGRGRGRGRARST